MSGNPQQPDQIPQLTPEELELLRKQQELQKEYEESVNEAFDMFMQKYAPATAKDFDDEFTTHEIFELIDNHLPETVALRDIPRYMRKLGYCSKYNAGTQSFSWLVRTI
jgi:hypothetical protein